MKNFRKNIIWIIAFAFIWMLISVYVYVCTIRGFCQTKTVSEEISSIRQEKNIDINEENDSEYNFKDAVTKNENEVITKNNTERVIKCYTYLNSFISRKSNKNIKSEVLKLENFFNKFYDKNLEEDGLYGDYDVEAVKEFQEENNLEIDGAVGSQTQKIINAIYCVKTEKK